MHFNPFQQPLDILLNTYLVLLKAPCRFMTDVVYSSYTFCNFHIEYLTAVNKFNATRLLNKSGLL